MKSKRGVSRFRLSFCSLAMVCMGIMATGCSDDNGGGSGAGAAGDPGAMRITEVMFVPSSGPEWVELYNKTDNSVDLRGMEIRNERGDTYRIPEDIPYISPGGMVLILFDGEGDPSIQVDVTNNCMVLHTDTLYGDVFDDTSDSCKLYRKGATEDSSPIDFVAWGDYGHGGHYVNNAQEYGSPGPVTAGQSIGVPADVYDTAAETTWVIYGEEETTPGSANPNPAPLPVVPGPNDVMRTDLPSFAWDDWLINVEAYYLEVDDNADFDSPIISVETPSSLYHTETPLPDGSYYWRVKSVSASFKESDWSQTVPFEIKTPENIRSRLIKTNDVWLHPPVLQRKDTPMLCLPCQESGKHPWNNQHIGDTLEGYHDCIHCKHYCVRAAVAMINRYYKGTLTQDEISYEMYKNDSTSGKEIGNTYVNDLGHGKGCGKEAVTAILKWALKNQESLTPEDISFSQIMKYIDEGRPLVSATPKHVLVLDGYHDYEDDNEDTIHVVNPWTHTEYQLAFSKTAQKTIWAPIRGSDDQGRKGSPLIRDANYNWTDSDKDGILDFDEINRFGIKQDVTNPLDSDDDKIPDLTEIWAFRFGKGMAPRYPDKGWGIWNKPDFDGNNLMDGMEDLNQNGNVDPGECDPFIIEKLLKVTIEVAGADGGSPSAEINGQSVQYIQKTGSIAGYVSREVYFIWCGLLKLGTNSIKITALKSGSNDLYDDIQIQRIMIVDQDNNKTLLESTGPFHLGDNTVASIWEEWEAGKWLDPNPPAFWMSLHGTSLTLDFSWTGYQL